MILVNLTIDKFSWQSIISRRRAIIENEYNLGYQLALNCHSRSIQILLLTFFLSIARDDTVPVLRVTHVSTDEWNASKYYVEAH